MNPDQRAYLAQYPGLRWDIQGGFFRSLGGWPDISFGAPYSVTERARAEAESRARWDELNDLAVTIGPTETEEQFVQRAEAIGLG